MRCLRRSLTGLAFVAAALIGGQAHAGPISLSIDLNGIVIFTQTSVSPDQSVFASLAAANSALTSQGSAYQFTALSAQSNYTGSAIGSLQTSFQLNTSGAGTTLDVLSIDTVQTGFLSPTGAGGMAVSTAGGSFLTASGSLSYTSDYQGANTPTLVFPVSGTSAYSGTTGLIPVGTVPSGFELSNHFLIALSKGDTTFLGGTGGVVLTAVPEPASVTLMMAGVAVVGLVLPRLRRKAGA
jgi:hypothetical protein